MRAKERKRQFVPSKLWNSEVFYRRRAERVRIAKAGLRCFNNPSGNDLSYRIIAVVQFEDAKGAFIGGREPLDIIRSERRLLQYPINRHEVTELPAVRNRKLGQFKIQIPRHEAQKKSRPSVGTSKFFRPEEEI